jgi:hypothetical protein
VESKSKCLDDPDHAVAPASALDQLSVGSKRHRERAGCEPEEIDLLVDRVDEARGVDDDSPASHYAKRLSDGDCRIGFDMFQEPDLRLERRRIRREAAGNASRPMGSLRS